MTKANYYVDPYVGTTCPYCHQPAKLVSGKRIYPRSPKRHNDKYWWCEPCDAFTGCHKKNRRLGFKGDEPFGTLANKELRRLRHDAHRAFDPIWKEDRGEFYGRREVAYRWLATKLGVTPDACHIGLFGVDQCLRVIDIMDRPDAEVLKHATDY